MSTSRKLVASGQNGQQPILMIWNSNDASMIAKKKLPKGSRKVAACAISKDDKKVVAADASEKKICYVFNIEGGAKPIQEVKIG